MVTVSLRRCGLWTVNNIANHSMIHIRVKAMVEENVVQDTRLFSRSFSRLMNELNHYPNWVYFPHFIFTTRWEWIRFGNYGRWVWVWPCPYGMISSLFVNANSISKAKKSTTIGADQVWQIDLRTRISNCMDAKHLSHPFVIQWKRYFDMSF